MNPSGHKPIVDLALFQAAQRPSGPTLAPLRSAKSAYLLSGLLRCAACRYALQGTTSSRGKRIYRCTRRHAAGICPHPVRVAAEPVETAVVEAFWKITRDLEARGRRDSNGALQKAEAKLQRAERNFERWLSPEVQDEISDLPEYASGLRRRREARDRAALALGHVRAAAEPVETLPVARLSKAWDSMTVKEQRELLALRFDCISLAQGGRVVAYPAGLGPEDLPRRGFKRAPELQPFPEVPRGVRRLTV